MLKKGNKNSNSGLENYESNYMDLPFENVLREYRINNIQKTYKRYPHKLFLEIGCGPYPLFIDFSDFDKMTVVEPGILFYKLAKKKANSNPRILIINNRIENILDKLKQERFEFIVIGGFLHEIENPDIVLQAVRNICSEDTIIYSFVPNARSFHRLLAFKMGLIEDIFKKSGHDELFQRHKVYDINTFNELLTRNKFKIIESGSYFVKPFTHDQMDELVKSRIFNKTIIDGLDKMIDYLPDMGAEIWNSCKIDD